MNKIVTLVDLQSRTSHTGYKHVYHCTDTRRAKPYIALISKQRKVIGHFTTALEAAKAVVEYLSGNPTKTTRQSPSTPAVK